MELDGKIIEYGNKLKDEKISEYHGGEIIRLVLDAVKEMGTLKGKKAYRDLLDFIYRCTLWKGKIKPRTLLNSVDDFCYSIPEDRRQDIKGKIQSLIDDEVPIGRFGAGKFKIAKYENDSKKIIKMLVKIKDLNDNEYEKIYDIAEKYLNERISGVKAGIISQILWTMFPNVFPVLNSEGRKHFSNLGIQLENPDNLTTYIENARHIMEIRNKYFKWKNMLLFEEMDKPPSPPVPKNIILYGPPGTGKTFSIQYLVALIENGKTLDYARRTITGKNLADDEEGETLRKTFSDIRDEGRYEFITFHQSYSFEDFIEGYRPAKSDEKLRIELVKGIFKKFAHEAGEHPNENYYFIIDEINRGNISKIFGELITLIEEDKRSEDFAVTLPYSREKFYVPPNIFIIGTMNTADKSIALIDVALRRRFVFVEMMPNLNLIEDEKSAAILEKINEIIEKRLGREKTIGHSYFMQKYNHDFVFKYQIKPLLEEYFYGEDIRTIFKDDNDILSVLGLA